MLPFCPAFFRLLHLLGVRQRLPFTFWNSSLLLSTSSFRGQLCFVEVLLTPRIECLCLHPFQSKSSSKCYWFFDPLSFWTLVFFCVCHSERLLLHAISCSWWITDFFIFIFIFFDELLFEFWYKSFAFLGHWSPELFSVTVWVLWGVKVSAEVWWSYSLEDQRSEVGALLTQCSIPKPSKFNSFPGKLRRTKLA